MPTRRPISSHEANLLMYDFMNDHVRFARGIASDRRHFSVARSPQFARWFLRHRGPAQTVGLGTYQFVYRYLPAQAGSFTLRITTPLHFSQVTYASTSQQGERWQQLSPRAAQDVSTLQSTIFSGPTNFWHTRFVHLESSRGDRRNEAAAARSAMSWPAAAFFLTRPVEQSTCQHPGGDRRVLLLRTEKGPLLESSMSRFPSPPAVSSHLETPVRERIFVRQAASNSARDSSALGSFALGSTADSGRNFISVTQRNTLGSTQVFLTSQTRSLSFLNSRFFGGAAASGVPMGVSFALMRSTTVGASPSSTPALPGASTLAPNLSFALHLPVTRATRDLQLAPGMVLSTRPEQVLATGSTSYVFTQQPRPVAAEPPRDAFNDRREVVSLVQKEIHNAMSSGAVVKHFSRHDFVTITDQVESLLTRRLLVEKERLGFSG
jgi:hypothetical protein